MRENNTVLKYLKKWWLGGFVPALGTVDLGIDGFLVRILMELCTGLGTFCLLLRKLFASLILGLKKRVRKRDTV